MKHIASRADGIGEVGPRYAQSKQSLTSNLDLFLKCISARSNSGTSKEGATPSQKDSLNVAQGLARVLDTRAPNGVVNIDRKMCQSLLDSFYAHLPYSFFGWSVLVRWTCMCKRGLRLLISPLIESVLRMFLRITLCWFKRTYGGSRR